MRKDVNLVVMCEGCSIPLKINELMEDFLLAHLEFSCPLCKKDMECDFYLWNEMYEARVLGKYGG